MGVLGEVLQLNEQAFGQVPGAAAHRVQLLHQVQHRLDLFQGQFHLHVAGEACLDGFQGLAEVAVLVDGIHQCHGDGAVLLAHGHEVELPHEVFAQGFPAAALVLEQIPPLGVTGAAGGAHGVTS
jgi:hypothetical protein